MQLILLVAIREYDTRIHGSVKRYIMRRELILEWTKKDLKKTKTREKQRKVKINVIIRASVVLNTRYRMSMTKIIDISRTIVPVKRTDE